MSDPSPSDGLLSGGRPPFFRYVLRLYSTDQVFRGVIDFAAIGVVVLLFMHPPSMDWFRGGTKAPVTSAPKPADAGHPQATAPTPSTPTNTGPSPSAPSSASAAPRTASPTPVTPSAPALAPISASIPMPVIDEVGRPGLLARFLIDIDEDAFRSSEPEDRQRLTKAAQAQRASSYLEMPDHLVGARSSDPNVAFMRGVAALHQRLDGARYSRAADQFRAAVAGGHVQAGTLLGVLLVSAPAGVDKDVTTGKRLIEDAAAKGDRMAQRAAGIGYFGGEFGVLDPFKAAGFFKSASAAGDLPAMLAYAHMLFTGSGVEKDEGAAEELVERAARGGHTIAQATLGSWIVDRYKSGVIGDPSDGVRWLERAFRQGFSMTALIRLALFYGDVGRSPPWKDRAKAFELFSLAAPFADQRAQYGYATGLHYGYTVAKDPAKAYVHYELARQLGSKSAEARLKTLDELLSPSEKAAAIEEARLRRRELKPNPDILIVQHPELPQPPSPWAAQSSDGATTVRQP